MHILFLTPYPIGEAPSQRFRFEQYFEFIKKTEKKFDNQSFMNQKTWDILYKKGNKYQKVIGTLKGFARRFWILTKIHKYDFIFIHREATPIGFPIIEFLLTSVFCKKVIFDFDDAIWLPNTSSQNKVIAWIKWHQKTSYTCKKAYKISCGNSFLVQYARQFNQNVVLNPTTIDTIHHHNKLRDQSDPSHKTIIGWTGTHSTMKYLPSLLPTLDKIAKKRSIEFRIISNQKPDFERQYLHFVRWNKETEIEDLLCFHIGLMPLNNDLWAQGKCGFKALQYMALGIPPIASDVGANSAIIKHTETGFLCRARDDWEDYINQLTMDENLRINMGEKARKSVEEYYSVSSNQTNFLSLFS